MLAQIRTFSHNPFVKFLLGMLALSFMVWGIGTKSVHKDYVASIGKENHITKADFERAKRNFLLNIRQTYGQKNLEPQNINQIVLRSLVQTELLRAESGSLGLLTGENVALEEIKKMPIFKNKEGIFDKDNFKNFLSSRGISESDFVSNIQKDISVTILNSIFTPYFPSEALIKEFFDYNNQKRVVDFVTIRPNLAMLHDAPITDKDIEKYYSAHKETFAVPEARDIEYITITPAEYRNKVKISAEELSNELSSSENSKANKDVIAQIKENLLVNKIYKAMHDSIKVIEDEIAGGSGLKDLAKKYQLPHKSIKEVNNAGQSQESRIKAPKFDKFLEQAFSANEGTPSDTSAITEDDASSGYYILNVPKVYESHHKALDKQTKEDVRTAIKEVKRGEVLKEKSLKLYNQIVSGDKTLEQIRSANPNVSYERQIIGKSEPKGSASADLLTNIFALQDKNSHTNMFKSNELHAFQFAIVKEIKLPDASKLSSEKINDIKGQLSNYLTAAINQEFLSYLYTKYEVKIFPDVMKELESSQDPN